MKKKKKKIKENKKTIKEKTTFTTPSRAHWKSRTKSKGSLTLL